jgi:hypothetical protein
MFDKATRYLSRQYVRRRVAEMVAPGYPILLDYPLRCSHRYGYGKPPHQQLFAILEAGRNEYAKRLSAFCSLKGLLSQIPAESTPEAIEPCWGPQRNFSSLDAVALYGMLFEFRPKRFVEVGSGYSTKFARRAIDDHLLPSRITSIDPAPRAEIDRLCDSVIRRLLEELDLNIFDELEPGDFLFIDARTELSQTPMSRSFLWMCCHGFKPGLSYIFTIYSGHMIIFRKPYAFASGEINML